MTSLRQDRILLSTAAGGALLVLVSYAIFGGVGAIAAAAGAGIATANWLVTRRLGQVVATRGKGALLATMSMKTAFVGVLCWICITRLGLHFFGFTLGISAIVIGVVVGPMVSPPPEAPSDPSDDPRSAGEPHDLRAARLGDDAARSL